MIENPAPLNQPPHKLHMPKPKFLMAFLVIILAGTASALYIFVFNNKITNPNEYRYHKLNSYSLTQGLSGSGIIFEKPVEFKVSYLVNTSVILIHDLANKQLSAYIAAAVTPLKTPLFASDLQNYNQVLASPSNNYYGQTVKGIQTFTQNNFLRSSSQKGTVNFANAKKFTSANIKSNAWEFDFTAKDPVKNSQDIGKTIFAITPKGYYYFTVYATNLNWTDNQKVWNRVFDSLKINQ